MLFSFLIVMNALHSSLLYWFFICFLLPDKSKPLEITAAKDCND